MREPVRRRFVTDLPGFRRLLIRQGGVSSHREISGNKNSYIGVEERRGGGSRGGWTPPDRRVRRRPRRTRHMLQCVSRNADELAISPEGGLTHRSLKGREGRKSRFLKRNLRTWLCLAIVRTPVLSSYPHAMTTVCYPTRPFLPFCNICTSASVA